MPGSDSTLLFAFLVTLFVGFAAFALFIAWWILRMSSVETLKVNLRLADQVRDANTCIVALSQKPFSADIAVAREETDRLIRATEAENGIQQIDTSNGQAPLRVARAAVPTT